MINTKQEWQAEPDGRITTDCGNITVAEVFKKKNARLMASAPELLEALKDCVKALSERVHKDFPVIKEAKQAIAKAEGITK